MISAAYYRATTEELAIRDALEARLENGLTSDLSLREPQRALSLSATTSTSAESAPHAGRASTLRRCPHCYVGQALWTIFKPASARRASAKRTYALHVLAHVHALAIDLALRDFLGTRMEWPGEAGEGRQVGRHPISATHLSCDSVPLLFFLVLFPRRRLFTPFTNPRPTTGHDGRQRHPVHPRRSRCFRFGADLSPHRRLVRFCCRAIVHAS